MDHNDIPPELRDPKEHPKLLSISAIVSAIIGGVVYYFSNDVVLSAAVGVLCVVLDYIVLETIKAPKDNS